MNPGVLSEIVAQYYELFPEEKAGLKRLLDQLQAGDKMNDRRNFTGHITGSAIVLSPDKTQVLLIHHKLFQRWQQPGGHWESDDEADPLVASRREAQEETGVELAEFRPLDPNWPVLPLDIDSHNVPARPVKAEPAHVHHDWRYAFIAQNTELKHQEEEVSAAAWFALDAPETQVIQRPIAKLRKLGLV